MPPRKHPQATNANTRRQAASNGRAKARAQSVDVGTRVIGEALNNKKCSVYAKTGKALRSTLTQFSARLSTNVKERYIINDGESYENIIGPGPGRFGDRIPVCYGSD